MKLFWMFFLVHLKTNLLFKLMYSYNQCSVVFRQKQRNTYWGSRREPTYSLIAGQLARIQYVSGRSCDLPSWHRFSRFFRLQANVEMVPKSQLATACFSCIPALLNTPKLNQLLWRLPNYYAKLCYSATRKTKIMRYLSTMVHKTYYDI
jgi:hypothetical protein